MSKFATIEKDLFKENLYIISYYWWDSIITNNEFGEWRVYPLSEHTTTEWTSSYETCLNDLSKWWYTPQCEYNWKLFFVKRNIFWF
jgi:hypothetical protein